MKFYNQICIHNESLILLYNLDRLVTWCDQYNLHVNISKCYIVSYTSETSPYPLVIVLSKRIVSFAVEFNQTWMEWTLLFKCRVCCDRRSARSRLGAKSIYPGDEWFILFSESKHIFVLYWKYNLREQWLFDNSYNNGLKFIYNAF